MTKDSAALSGRQKLNIALGCSGLLLLALHFGVEHDPTIRLEDGFTDMLHSKALGSFAPKPEHPEGETLRQPQAGTIARGSMPLRFAAGVDEAKRAGAELASPQPKAEGLAEGERLYGIYCALCHDSAGTGRGPVTKRGFPPPPSLLAEQARNMKDGEIFHLMTFGRGNMPGHAAQILPQDRWQIVQFIRALQATK